MELKGMSKTPASCTHMCRHKSRTQFNMVPIVEWYDYVEAEYYCMWFTATSRT